jgi:hypothetical protein
MSGLDELRRDVSHAVVAGERRAKDPQPGGLDACASRAAHPPLSDQTPEGIGVVQFLQLAQDHHTVLFWVIDDPLPASPEHQTKLELAPIACEIPVDGPLRVEGTEELTGSMGRSWGQMPEAT